MKRFFTKSVVLLLLVAMVGLFSPATIFAATSTTATSSASYKILPTDSSLSPTTRLSNQITNLANEKVQLEKTIKSRGTAATPEEQQKLDVLNGQIQTLNGQAQSQISSETGGWFSKISNAVSALTDGIGGIVSFVFIFFLENLVMPIVSFWVFVAGKVLNFAVFYTVWGDGFQSLSDVIQSVWTLTRDIFNVTFIFMLLYIAIRKIIGSAGLDVKKMMTSVIVAALFINFSLLITKVAIDAGNRIAISIFRQITLNTETVSTIFTQAESDFGSITGGNYTSEIQLSERIMNSLKLTTLLDEGDLIPPSVGATQAIKSVIKLIMFIITFFVFFFMSLLLIGRFVMLVFLMATAPIGFVGFMGGVLKQGADGWKKLLIDQTLVAPIFMFFMLVIIKVSDAVSKTPSQDGMVLYFNFFFTVYLIAKAIEITKSLSGDIGKFADGITKAGTGALLAAGTGGAAVALQGTLGRLGAAAAQSETLKGMAAKSGITGAAGRLALKTSDRAANASFNVRNTPVAKKTFEGIKDATGLDLGIGALKEDKGSLVASRDAYAKEQTEFAKKQLSREVSKEGALAELQNIKRERDTTFQKMVSATNPAEKNALRDKIKKQDQLFKDQGIDFELLKKHDSANNAGEKNKILEQIQKQQNARYQSGYASSIETEAIAGRGSLYQMAASVANGAESGFVGALKGAGFAKTAEAVKGSVSTTKATDYNKAAAAKIRKDVIKGKSTDQQAKELLEKMQKEKDAAEGKTEDKPKEDAGAGEKKEGGGESKDKK